MRLLHNERGTAVVEFALVAPLLFLLVFGIVNFGRALDYYNQMTQLAAQGARAAAVDQNPDGSGPPTASSIQSQLATTYTGQPELKNGEVICITQAPSAVGQPVTVKASFVFNFAPFGVAAGLHLVATSTQRAEVVPLDSNNNPNLGYAVNRDQNGAACS
jgi:Flp pilus assembly protein TadG